MINRMRSSYDSEFDFGQDRDLIALVNEARSPETLSSVTAIARDRFRARRQARLRRAGGSYQHGGHISHLRVAKPRV
jgi:hypothetical protein